jgi:signal transduction histidine kinase
MMRTWQTRRWGRLAVTLTVTAIGVAVWLGVRAARAGDVAGVQVALVFLAAAALIAVLVGRVRVRRQARSLDERTAMLEQLASDLSRANRAKGEFLANVSHELRTPLAAIVGFVEMLREGVYGELTQRQAGPVERIETSANHLRELVDDILDLSKLAAARMEVHAEPLALRPFVLDVVSEIEPIVIEKGLALSISIGTTLPKVRTDPTHLRQILVNLVGNAVKFTMSGTVSVRARLVEASQSAADRAFLPQHLPAAHGVWIALAVQDTGVGIAAPDQARIFEEFEQVDAGPRGDSMARGTGLGLSISRRLAQLLGGDITLESAAGRGSSFTLWIPVDPGDLRERGHERSTRGHE